MKKLLMNRSNYIPYSKKILQAGSMRDDKERIDKYMSGVVDNAMYQEVIRKHIEMYKRRELIHTIITKIQLVGLYIWLGIVRIIRIIIRRLKKDF